MNGCSWLEWNVIVVGHGIYLLIDNDGGDSVGYLYLSQQSVVKSDSDDECGSEKNGTRCQGCGCDDSIVFLHECSG